MLYAFSIFLSLRFDSLLSIAFRRSVQLDNKHIAFGQVWFWIAGTLDLLICLILYHVIHKYDCSNSSVCESIHLKCKKKLKL